MISIIKWWWYIIRDYKIIKGSSMSVIKKIW